MNRPKPPRRRTSSEVKIQCLLPKRNNGEYFEVALKSLTEQTYPFSNITVSDNYSTDGSYVRLQEVAGEHQNVNVVRPPVPLESYGEHIAWLIGEVGIDSSYTLIASSDDVWHANFNSAMVHEISRFLEHPMCLFCDRIFIDSLGKRLGATGNLSRPSSLDGQRAFDFYLQGCCYIISGALFQTSLLKPLADLLEKTRNAADWFLLLEAARTGEVRYLAKGLFDYRVHPQGTGVNAGIDDSEHVLVALDNYALWLEAVGDSVAARRVVCALESARGGGDRLQTSHPRVERAARRIQMWSTVTGATYFLRGILGRQ